MSLELPITCSQGGREGERADEPMVSDLVCVQLVPGESVEKTEVVRSGWCSVFWHEIWHGWLVLHSSTTSFGHTQIYPTTFEAI